MKKGQKVRILRTNQVATIVEVELIRKGGKVHRYCHLKTDEKSYLWLDSSELGCVVEEVKVSVVDDRNRELHLAICQDYSKDKMTLHLTGKNPDNLKEASGLYWKPEGNAGTVGADNVLDNSPIKQFLCTLQCLKHGLASISSGR